MPNPKSNEQRGIDRRRFLTTFALGASAAPLLSLGRTAFARSDAGAQAASLCYSNKRVLSSSDLQYLGMLRFPTGGGVRMDFHYGPMTGRVVNGQTRLLVTGNTSTQGDPLYEFTDPGTYGQTLASAPQLTLVRNWGDIYGQCRVTYDNMTGALRSIPGRTMGGVHWSERQQMIYWTYFDNYNVGHYQDWSLGATRLDPNGPQPFGPWRVSAPDGKKGPWHCTRISEHPLTGEMLCGASIASGNNWSPWGPEVWAGALPTASTPAGFGAPDLPLQKYLTYYPAIPQIRSDGSYSGALRACRRPGDYAFEGCIGGVLTEIDPAKNGGVGSWSQLDLWHDMTWIDLPDVVGVLYTGALASQHIWYSNAGTGHLNCCHGNPPPPGVQITGPVSTDGYPFMAIYDPADLNAVRSGSKIDYSVDPTEMVNARSRWNLKTRNISGVGSANVIAGQFFNPQTRTLYIAAPEADDSTPYYWASLVHVFRIN